MSTVICGIGILLIAPLVAGGLFYWVVRERAKGPLTATSWWTVGLFSLGAFLAVLGVTINWLSEGKLHSVAFLGGLCGGMFMGAAVATAYWRSSTPR